LYCRVMENYLSKHTIYPICCTVGLWRIIHPWRYCSVWSEYVIRLLLITIVVAGLQLDKD